MKRIILLLCLVILTGCDRSTVLYIDKNSITNIIYDKMNINNNDYDLIISEINNNKFYKLLDNSITGENLVINTNEKQFNFNIVNEYIIYTMDNTRYFTKSNNLLNNLNKIKIKYLNNDFYTVDKYNNYNINDSDILITLDNSNSYLIINSELNIYNFKIEKVNSYMDNFILNSIDMVESNKIICIRANDLANIKISFDTPYNYNVSIIYDGKIKKKINPK